ncbi:MAG TPA: XRE family transcriptional regulator [Phycisphaeraceae bacterium]
MPPRTPPPATPPDTDPFRQLVSQRVAQLRRQRRWTLEQLAAASGVSRSMLSQIERGRASPTIAVAHRIAQAMELSLAELVQTPDAPSSLQVIRADDRAYHYRSEPGCRIRTLSPLHLEKDVEFYELSLGPGKALRSAPHFQGTREFLTIQKGRARIVCGRQTSDLRRGDSAHYRADVEHAIENIGPSDLLAFLIVTYASS